ncbi:MAG: phosphonate ABC transporter, permease protein PhnE, partial [Defluviitaleaceae bacterium]|nr:phosphonate ABC transporter, permease protein PhnE [Defluviitaleaceae bacterium]
GGSGGGRQVAAPTAPEQQTVMPTRQSPVTRTHFLSAALAILIFMSFFHLRVNPINVFTAFPGFFRFMRHNFLPPNFTGVTAQLPIVLRTLLFAVVATYISAFVAFFFGLLMARETNPLPPLRWAVRFFVSFLRNVPLLVWGTVLVFIFGIGSLLGVVTLVLATLGFLARSYADSIDDIAGSKLEALRANGAGYLQIMCHGLVPEFIPAWVNWTLFSFEINIRASAVLGMVGAGGLGLLIQTNLELRGFRRAMALILILVAMVLATEFLVNGIRRLMTRQRVLPPAPAALCKVALTVGLVALFFAASRSLELNFTLFAQRFINNIGTVAPRLAAFNAAALPEVFRQLFISMLIGICALFIGAAVSLVLAFFAAGNIAPFRPLAWAIKGAISVVRAVPSLVLILMVVASLGFGYTTAVVGLMFSSVGYLTKAFIASIEEQDAGIIEAMGATGAGRLQIIFHGLLPSCATAFVSWVSIRLESNISDSISIGIVGAGGVGMLIARANRQLDFPTLSTAIVVIFVVMVGVEFGTGRLRRRLRG